MNKIKNILKTQFGVECIDISEIYGGLSAMNYKVKTDDKTFFLKVYDKRDLTFLSKCCNTLDDFCFEL